MKKLPLKELAPLLAKIHKKEFQAGLFGILDYFLGRFGKGRLSKFIQN